MPHPHHAALFHDDHVSDPEPERGASSGVFIRSPKSHSEALSMLAALGDMDEAADRRAVRAVLGEVLDYLAQGKRSFENLGLRCPHLWSRIEQLDAARVEQVRRCRQLYRDCHFAEWEVLQEGIEALSQAIDEHDHGERQLLLDAHLTDLGVAG